MQSLKQVDIREVLLSDAPDPALGQPEVLSNIV